MNASMATQVAANESLVRIEDKGVACIKTFGLRMKDGPFRTAAAGGRGTLMERAKGGSQICAETGAAGLMTCVKLNCTSAGIFAMEEKTERGAAA